MNITLVRPTTFLNMNTHPLNIGYIYAALRTESYLNISFIDGERIGAKYINDKDDININSNHQMWNDIAQKIIQTEPEIVAFSCYSLSMTAANRIIHILRTNNYTGHIWAGGIHPTTCYTETLDKIDGLNGIVIGEGEETMREVCRMIHAGEDLRNVKGIAYRKDGEIVITESRSLIKNMDELPIPSRTFSGRYNYTGHILLTSRGCPFCCDFCDSKNMWTRRVRYRSGDHVAREIETIANLGIKNIGIRDDTFTLNRNHVENVCKAITERRLDQLKYSVGSRIDTMNDEMIVLLKKMNVKKVTFGVETGSPVMQKRINKKLNIDTVVPMVLKTNSAGIRTLTFFMLGHPGETEKDIGDTYTLIRDLSKHCNKRNVISINIVCPYPGTVYWEYATRKHGNFIDLYNESYRYYHQETPSANITNMKNQTYLYHIDRISRYVKTSNLKYKIYTAVGNPNLVMSKIKEKVALYPFGKSRN